MEEKKDNKKKGHSSRRDKNKHIDEETVWVEIDAPDVVRSSNSQPSWKPQALVQGKYIFSLVDRRYNDRYRCKVDDDHICPSLLNKDWDVEKGNFVWKMSPHLDNNECIAYQAKGLWMECEDDFVATKYGDFLVDNSGQGYEIMPHGKDYAGTLRKSQSVYKCIEPSCNVEIRTWPGGSFETWSTRNNETKVFMDAVHQDEHLPPVSKIAKIREVNESTYDIDNTVLRKQVEQREKVKDTPMVVSTKGKVLSNLLDELGYLYNKRADQFYGRKKIFGCNTVSCKGKLEMIKPENGVEIWERVRHDPVNDIVINGVKKSWECRKKNAELCTPLKSGRINYYKHSQAEEDTTINRVYISAEEEGNKYLYLSMGTVYGNYYRCTKQTCLATLRVVVEESRRVWERKTIRVNEGGKFHPVRHTCTEIDSNVLAGAYELINSEKISYNKLDANNGNELDTSQGLGEPEQGLDEEEDEADVSVAIVMEAQASASGCAQASKKARIETDEEVEIDCVRTMEPQPSTSRMARVEMDQTESGANFERVRPVEEFVGLFESPVMESQSSGSQSQGEIAEQVAVPLTSTQIIKIVDEYAGYHHHHQHPGKRAEYWKQFIEECKELNNKNRNYCIIRKPGRTVTCKIPEFEDVIFWSEKYDTLGYYKHNMGVRYKCSVIDCNKLMASRFLGTCTDHAVNRCFSFVAILLEDQDIDRLLMTYTIRTYDHTYLLNWTDSQAVTCVRTHLKFEADKVKSVLQRNIKLPDGSAEIGEKRKWYKIAKEFYASVQVASFLTTSFRIENIQLVREQLDLEFIGLNFKQILHLNGFDYELRDETQYKQYVKDKYNWDEKKASFNFKRMVEMAQRDVHAKQNSKKPNELSRLCYKLNCKKARNWFHIYFVNFLRKKMAEEQATKEKKKDKWYIGLAPPESSLIIAACHYSLSTDTTNLGKYMRENGYSSITELQDSQMGYMMAKETYMECRVAEGLAIFGLVLLVAENINDMGLINKYMPVFRKYTTEDLLDLRTLLLAKFGVLLYANVAGVRRNETYLILEEGDLIEDENGDEEIEDGGEDEF